MNTKQILAKISRNLTVLGIANTADASSVTISTGAIISTIDADIAKPLGGIDPSASPFLGIGVANPGKIRFKGAAGDNTLAAIFTTETDFIALRLCCQFANDVSIEAGDTATTLASLPGDPDARNLGQ